MQGVLKISEGSNLGIHALAYLAACQNGEPVSVIRMSEELGVSRDHLGKVMQRLSRMGMVGSRRGPRGGFTLSRAPSDVTLLEVVEAIDGPVAAPGCLLGHPVCAPGHCSLSALAQEVHAHVVELLRRTRLSDLPSPVPGSTKT